MAPNASHAPLPPLPCFSPHDQNVGLHRQMEYIATMIDALVNYTAVRPVHWSALPVRSRSCCARTQGCAACDPPSPPVLCLICQGSCDTDARWSTIDRTVGLRERLETLSAQEFADAGPVRRRHPLRLPFKFGSTLFPLRTTRPNPSTRQHLRTLPPLPTPTDPHVSAANTVITRPC